MIFIDKVANDKYIPTQKSFIQNKTSNIDDSKTKIFSVTKTDSISSSVKFEFKKYEITDTENQNLKNLLSEINELFKECSLADWDGYNALPLEETSKEQLVSFLRFFSGYGLLRNISIDDICPNPHGTISLSKVSANNDLFNIEFGETSFTITSKIKDTLFTWESIKYSDKISMPIIKDFFFNYFNI